MIGNTPISFENNEIRINDRIYPMTRGLMELPVKKHPDMIHLIEDDKEKYRKILENSSVLRKKFEKDRSLRTHNSNKFNNIIAPLLKKPKVLYFSTKLLNLTCA